MNEKMQKKNNIAAIHCFRDKIQIEFEGKIKQKRRRKITRDGSSEIARLLLNSRLIEKK